MSNSFNSRNSPKRDLRNRIIELDIKEIFEDKGFITPFDLKRIKNKSSNDTSKNIIDFFINESKEIDGFKSYQQIVEIYQECNKGESGFTINEAGTLARWGRKTPGVDDDTILYQLCKPFVYNEN